MIAIDHIHPESILTVIAMLALLWYARKQG